MKQFNLQEYLDNPNKNVVTRKGMPVRIICIDRKTEYSKIIALVTVPSGYEEIFCYNNNGMECVNYENDLFFPDEEEDLSEDDRIRKEIIDYLKKFIPHCDDDLVAKSKLWIAWLEKQGEKEKPVEWSEDDEVGLGDALWAIEQAKTIAKDENDMGNLWYAEKWLKYIKDRVLLQPKQGEQKPAWSKEDERKLNK